MSGRGGKKKSKTMSKSARAGVLFPVARMLRYLKNSTHHFRVGAGAPVYMAAVIEYLTGNGLNFLMVFVYTLGIIKSHIINIKRK